MVVNMYLMVGLDCWRNSMDKLTNNSNIPLSVAVFLASNSYDFVPRPKSLSATDFNRSIRQVILRNRVNANKDYGYEPVDIMSLVKSKNGTAIHDAIEKTWVNDHSRNLALRNLGYPDSVIEKIVVNPNPAEVTPDQIPVYMEIRKEIEIDGWTISGKFDFVADDGLTDFKSTSTFTYEKQTNVDKYKVQGSIYKLIHSDIIKKDYLTIMYWFTDWSQNKALSSPKYPQAPILPQKINLMTSDETTRYIRSFIKQLEEHENTPEEDLPLCTPKELWQDLPTYKYYRDPTKRTRSTKNFDSFYEAQQYFISDGSRGLVVESQAMARACAYCPAASVCSQRQSLEDQGLLEM